MFLLYFNEQLSVLGVTGASQIYLVHCSVKKSNKEQLKSPKQ